MTGLGKTAVTWVGDEMGPKIWALIVTFRWWIAVVALIGTYFVDKGILLRWFDFNEDLLRNVRNIPYFGEDLELAFKLLAFERIMAIAEITFPLFLIGWTRRRLRIRKNRERRASWDAWFWNGVRRAVLLKEPEKTETEKDAELVAAARKAAQANNTA